MLSRQMYTDEYAINALPASNKVATTDKTAINAARKAYDALTAEQKAKVPATTVKKLENAERALAAAGKKAKKKKVVSTVTINVKKVNAKKLKAAVKKAGGNSKTITTIVLGKKVKKIKKGTFKKYKKAKTLVVKTRKLKKSRVKKALKGSAVSEGAPGERALGFPEASAVVCRLFLENPLFADSEGIAEKLSLRWPDSGILKEFSRREMPVSGIYFLRKTDPGIIQGLWIVILGLAGLCGAMRGLKWS